MERLSGGRVHFYVGRCQRISLLQQGHLVLGWSLRANYMLNETEVYSCIPQQ